MQMAKNKNIVDWVNHMVNFHRIRTEEKNLLDIVLKCIYGMLFPAQGEGLLLKLLNDLKSFIQ